jgi:hypothetical protein
MAAGCSVRYFPGCTSKMPFFSEGLARDTMRKWQKTKSGHLHMYHCKNKEMKNHWHLTSLPGSKKARYCKYREIANRRAEQEQAKDIC